MLSSWPTSTVLAPDRMFLARQPDHRPASPRPDAAAERRGSPWMSFLERRAPSKCWARKLAVIESWHSLLAQRDITVGNSQGERERIVTVV